MLHRPKNPITNLAEQTFIEWTKVVGNVRENIDSKKLANV